MRRVIAWCFGTLGLVVGGAALAQAEQGAPPAAGENGAPTMVVVLASGSAEVTDEALSQARMAVVSAASADGGRHGRAVRAEHDPGLSLRASNCSDETCFAEVGSDAGGALLFHLNLEPSESGFTATVTLVDVAAVQIRGSAVVDLPTNPSDFEAASRDPLGPLVTAIEPIGPTTGRLRIDVNHEAAAIFVDDRRVGTSPLAALEGVAPGVHSVRIALDGYQDYEQEMQIVAGRDAHMEAILVPVAVGEGAATTQETHRPAWRRWWFWTIIGGTVAAAVGLGVGLGVGLSGDDTEQEQEWLGVPFPEYEPR